MCTHVCAGGGGCCWCAAGHTARTVDLAVRQDSLNGAWISSEKSSQRLNSRAVTVIEWRASRNADGERRGRETDREEERKGVCKGKGMREGRRYGSRTSDVSLFAPPHFTLFIGIYNVMGKRMRRRKKDERCAEKEKHEIEEERDEEAGQKEGGSCWPCKRGRERGALPRTKPIRTPSRRAFSASFFSSSVSIEKNSSLRSVYGKKRIFPIGDTCARSEKRITTAPRRGIP